MKRLFVDWRGLERRWGGGIAGDFRAYSIEVALDYALCGAPRSWWYKDFSSFVRWRWGDKSHDSATVVFNAKYN